jgi:hypothetical protein
MTPQQENMTPQQEADARTTFDEARRIHEELVNLLGIGPASSQLQEPYWEIGTDFLERFVEIVEEWKSQDPDFPADMPPTRSAYASERSSSTANGPDEDRS